jgi:hypothetical protein
MICKPVSIMEPPLAAVAFYPGVPFVIEQLELC